MNSLMGATGAPAEKGIAHQMTTRPANRIIWLDLLRGAAIVMVLLFHFTVRYQQKYSGHAFADGAYLSFGFGWIGVHLFFMISGFIIYHTIQNKKGPLDFLAARLARLVPPYWAAIAAILLLEFAHAGVFGEPYRNTLVDTVFNLAMVPDVFDRRFLDGAFWSLYVEIKFYVFFALLWGLFDMRRRLFFYLTFAAVFAAASVHFFFFKFPLGDNFYYFLIFWAGIGAYKVMREDLSIWEFLVIIILTTAGTVGVYRDGNELLIGIPFFSILFLAAERAERRFPAAVRVLAPCAYLGRISYSCYLLHQPVGYIVLGALAAAAVGFNPAVALAVAGSFIAAFIGFTFVEKMDKPIAKAIMARIGRYERPYRR